MKTGQDIGDRLVAELALQQSEAKNRALLNAIPDMAFVFDRQGTYLDYNHSRCEDLILPPQDLIGKNVYEALPPDLAKEVMHHITQTFVTNEIQIFEYQLLIREQLKYYEARNVPIDGDHILTIVRDITERKQSEQALQESEKRYRVLFDSKSDEVFVHGINAHGEPTRFLEVNDVACRNLGYTRAELLQLSPVDIVDPSTKIPPNLLDEFRFSSPITLKTIHVRKNGQRYPVELRVTLFESNGKNMILAFARDISDRVSAEEALRESEKRYQALFNSDADAVFVHEIAPNGKPGKFMEVNDAACSSLGYTKAELMQLSPHDIIVPSTRIAPNVLDAFSSNSFLTVNTKHVRKDGSIFPVEARLTLMERNGKMMMLAFARDISDRVAAEEALRRSEERLQLARKIGKIGIFEWDMQTNDVTWNEELEIMFGLAPGGFTGKHGDWFDAVYPEDLLRVQQEIDNAIQHRTELDMDFRIVRPDGNLRWLTVKASIFTDESGHPLRMIGVNIDITNQKETETTLQRLAALDYLTQISNRLQFDLYLAEQWERLAREKQPLSLIMCDVDYFKAYNDTYGHQAGDLCLQQVAKAIQLCIKRPADLVSRYGGEEFAVILPNTDLDGARQLAAQMQQQLRDLQLLHEGSMVSDYITLSLGIASMIPVNELTESILVERADYALYEAKNQGRDRIYAIG